MTNPYLRYRIDMPHVNEDGTIEVLDTDFISDYSFTFQYKLYETVEENMRRLFNMLYSVFPEKYELTERFQKYVEERKSHYDEVQVYRKVVDEIQQSRNFAFEKQEMIKKIDTILNKLYPYRA